MKIEFLLIADAAQVADGKLFVLGGAWSVHRSVNFPSPIQFAVCLSVLVPWQEAGTRHPVTLTIADEAGVPIIPPLNGQFEVGKPAEMAEDTTQRSLLAINLNIAIPRAGRYAVLATAGPSKAETQFDAIFVGKKVSLSSKDNPREDAERGN
jgi:hypothetical protein